MASTHCSEPPAIGRRTAATWVAGTGAFLLLAAAAVFVGVRWDELPDSAKLAVVAALTGGFLAGGRALRRTLPATGDVLFHLGAFLVPVDLAGLNLRLGLGWRSLVLAEGIVSTATFASLASVSGSVVLGWAATAAVVTLAVGTAAVSPVPAPLALALAGAAAWALGRRRDGIAWSAIAGFAPILGTVVFAGLRLVRPDLGAGVLAELGLAGRDAALLAIASGVLAAGVLGDAARRGRDLVLAALAFGSLVTGAVTTWAAAGLPGDANALGAAGAFLALELVALLVARDEFWRRPVAAITAVVEVATAILVVPVTLALVLIAPLAETGFFGDDGPRPEPVAGVALFVLACAWLTAAYRRRAVAHSPLDAALAAAGHPLFALPFGLALVSAASVGTASTAATSLCLLGLALVFGLTGGGMGQLLAVAAALWVPVTTLGPHPLASLLIGTAAAFVVAEGAVRAGDRRSAVVLGIGATAVALASAAAGPGELGNARALVAVAACWALAVDLDRAAAAAGHVARGGMLLPLLAVLADDPLAVAVTVAVLAAVEVFRLDEPRVGLLASAAAQVVVVEAAQAAGLDLGGQGVALTVSAVVWAGLAVVTPERYRLPLYAAAATAGVVGLVLASATDEAIGLALLIDGALVAGAGALNRQPAVAHVGGGLAVLGIAQHLAVAEVQASEAYLAPVCVQLLVAGWQVRRTAHERPSSWVAYGPAVALLGGAAVVERLAGGDAWHAVLAGAVGVAALIGGGAWRLAAPLFIGTALVVTVTVLESLSRLAGVPTWAWLALGGTVLLGAGVAMERAGGSPVDAGRRLVDVISERFD